MPENKSTSLRKSKKNGKPARIESIIDFAKYLDLSVWTVSRAMNSHPAVNEKTRRRVLAAMEEVGYHPNPLARGLGGRRTGMIGVCSLGLGNPILNTKVFYLQEFLRKQNLRMVIELGARDPEKEQRVIEDFARMRVDGIVLLYSTLPTDLAASLLQGVACVSVDPHEPQIIPSISIDRQRAMRLLFEHLLRLGHRSFALLWHKEALWRQPALVEAAHAHGFDPDKMFRLANCARPDSSIEAGELMAQDVLRWPDRPTAMIAKDDFTALGAIQALREAGVEVPRHMSVTGFDNLEFARRLHPTLTTVEQNPERLMTRAGEILLEQLHLPPHDRGRAPAETIRPDLITGESSGPAWFKSQM